MDNSLEEFIRYDALAFEMIYDGDEQIGKLADWPYTIEYIVHSSEGESKFEHKVILLPEEQSTNSDNSETILDVIPP